MRAVPFLLLALLLPGCGSAPVGDAPEAEAARPASDLPQTAARRALDAARPHAGARGAAKDRR